MPRKTTDGSNENIRVIDADEKGQIVDRWVNNNENTKVTPIPGDKQGVLGPIAESLKKPEVHRAPIGPIVNQDT